MATEKHYKPLMEQTPKEFERTIASVREYQKAWHERELTALAAERKFREEHPEPDELESEGQKEFRRKAREKEQKAIETGVRGGRYYVSATGEKIYVKDNPGAQVVGQVSKHPFQSGLPATAFMQEPFRKI